MDFIEAFKARGYFYQCTDIVALESLITTNKIAAYIGFDATAPSLHIGHLVQIMIMRLLQQYGHKPIIVMGGTTTKIGDPSGKNEMRKILPTGDIEHNITQIKQSLSNFITFGDGPSDAIILNNSTWLENINYIDFLSNFGRSFSINKMISLDIVSSRLEKNLPFTFLELNYMLLQAYDFYYLNKEYNCQLQFSGSDQWGNIIMGLDLIKKFSKQECYGITTPLLTTSSGIKMGKSLKGAVWLNANLLSPYEYFQYWRNVEDLDVVRFAKLFAEFSDEQLQNFIAMADQNINEAKKQLAYIVTKLCHGKEAADSALQTSIALYENNSLTNEGIPTFYIELNKLEKGINICQFIYEQNLTASKGEAKKLVRGNGVSINDKKITDENSLIHLDSVQDEKIKLSLGKKKHYLIKLKS